jgi:hypothetical protein
MTAPEFEGKLRPAIGFLEESLNGPPDEPGDFHALALGETV